MNKQNDVAIAKRLASASPLDRVDIAPIIAQAGLSVPWIDKFLIPTALWERCVVELGCDERGDQRAYMLALWTAILDHLLLRRATATIELAWPEPSESAATA
ncbi:MULTISPECIES: hypothetical protein [Burkholderia]|uniref:hypothetical protein n=1 Tax=Burkholderia TaxID=32008 RepID=UPI001907F73D|nr:MULTISPECIES: hypothetical protein [Burkholderia]MBJ9920640.1 hypothetical protein [Burkholderia cenocepacia]MCA8180654.1 hypothetical protein [Burkholderia vietnamiensis]UVS90900.1 hypothetical protein EFP17_14635 [Burkholderia glumae]